jgi:hypothetical protein
MNSPSAGDKSWGRESREVSRIAGPDLVDDSLTKVRDPSATRIGGHTSRESDRERALVNQKLKERENLERDIESVGFFSL